LLRLNDPDVYYDLPLYRWNRDPVTKLLIRLTIKTMPTPKASVKKTLLKGLPEIIGMLSKIIGDENCPRKAQADTMPIMIMLVPSLAY